MSHTNFANSHSQPLSEDQVSACWHDHTPPSRTSRRTSARTPLATTARATGRFAPYNVASTRPASSARKDSCTFDQLYYALTEEQRAAAMLDFLSNTAHATPSASSGAYGDASTSNIAPSAHSPHGHATPATPLLTSMWPGQTLAQMLPTRSSGIPSSSESAFGNPLQWSASEPQIEPVGYASARLGDTTSSITPSAHASYGLTTSALPLSVSTLPGQTPFSPSSGTPSSSTLDSNGATRQFERGPRILNTSVATDCTVVTFIVPFTDTAQ